MGSAAHFLIPLFTFTPLCSSQAFYFLFHDTQFMPFLTLVSYPLLLMFLSPHLLEIHFSLSLFWTFKDNYRFSGSLISFLALACCPSSSLPSFSPQQPSSLLSEDDFASVFIEKKNGRGVAQALPQIPTFTWASTTSLTSVINCFRAQS